MPDARPIAPVAPGLRRAVVLRVGETGCEVWSGERVEAIRFAPIFPSPRTERVSPGHLVAVATADTGQEVVVWRWFDAVVLSAGTSGPVRLWEPGHGEIVAHLRAPHHRPAPGSRAYASAGLPGAEWWVAGPVVTHPADAAVDIDEVVRLFTDHGMWAAAFAPAG